LAGADVLLPALIADIEALLADKAYDAQERVLRVLASASVQAVIPSKSNRTVQRARERKCISLDT
jgi:hypothetical protein